LFLLLALWGTIPATRRLASWGWARLLLRHWPLLVRVVISLLLRMVALLRPRLSSLWLRWLLCVSVRVMVSIVLLCLHPSAMVVIIAIIPLVVVALAVAVVVILLVVLMFIPSLVVLLLWLSRASLVMVLLSSLLRVVVVVLLLVCHDGGIGRASPRRGVLGEEFAQEVVDRLRPRVQ
jgi:hypothetical protein